MAREMIIQSGLNNDTISDATTKRYLCTSVIHVDSYLYSTRNSFIILKTVISITILTTL